MSFCTNCGQQVADGAKFCANCGTPISQNTSNTERKIVFDGEIHKCPHCGAVLNAFEIICPSCGLEIRNKQGVSTVKQLSIKLEQLEAKRQPKTKKLKLINKEQIESIDKQKIELIKNFPIPNTKEDILEFIVYASSNINLKVYGFNSETYTMQDPACRELSDAWMAKLEQADIKAEIVFGNTQEYLAIRNIFEKKVEAIKKEKQKAIWLYVGISLGTLLFPAIVWLLVFLTGAI